MDILLIGAGGREHALAWKIKQSPRCSKLYIAPGNGGTAALGENVPIAAMEFEKLADFAAEKKIMLTIVGPDDPLAGGIADVFSKRGLRVWGPSQAAAQIEASKAFSKELMREAGIPTAAFEVFSQYDPALAYVHERGAPIVVKASGLALGKGVYVCATIAEAEQALKEIMVDRLYQSAGDSVVVEEYLDGQEISIHALSDGADFLLFPPSQDHKPIFDGDKGPNTGGMGTIAPVPWVSIELINDIRNHVVRPAIQALAHTGATFQGLLYPGLKMSMSGPKVLEFNARFGDPETQVYMRLLKSDILDLFDACIDGTLEKQSIEWEDGFAANIVIASGGYPNEYKKGVPISGIEDAEAVDGVVVFHAGTKVENGILVTNGGRVLGVSAVGATLKDALDRAYEAVSKIHFDGIYYRRDIGAKAFAS